MLHQSSKILDLRLALSLLQEYTPTLLLRQQQGLVFQNPKIYLLMKDSSYYIPDSNIHETLLLKLMSTL